MSGAAHLELPAISSASPSLRERVADALHAALITGAMIPGVTYSVPALAERFGVSATPVREAMLDLVKQGMVEPVPNKGFRVLAVSQRELDEVTQVRLLLEVPTVGSLAGRVTPSQADRLRALAGDITAAARSGDLVSYVDADHRFHLELLALAGNTRLVEIVRQLRARTRLYGLDHLSHEELATSCDEHVELVEALAGTASARHVEAILSRHIGHVRGIWAGDQRSEDEP